MAGMERGFRLLPTLIDDIAASDSGRSLVAIASRIDCSDFRDISFGVFANAINRAAWWMKERFGIGNGYPRLAYAGPQDIRYMILMLAGTKTDNQVRTADRDAKTVR